MAALTKLGSSPYGIRYQLDGAAGAVTKTQAQLVADLDEGPLKALLSRITTDAAWTALNNDVRFVFHITSFLSVNPDNVTVTWAGAPRTLSFTFGQTGNAYRVDTRFLPTPIM